MRTILTTKFSHWRYEAEERCFLDLAATEVDGGNRFISFSDDVALREVIVGPDLAVTRLGLREALGELVSTVEQRKARLSFQRFAVVTQRKRSMWA